MTDTSPTPKSGKRPNPAGRTLFLVLTGGCFVYLYYRLNGAATREGLTLTAYMTDVFANVQWLPWLGLMMAYSSFYFLVDTLVVTSDHSSRRNYQNPQQIWKLFSPEVFII